MKAAAAYDPAKDMAVRTKAIDSFVEKARKDKQIIACFFYGSTVRGDYWKNSDIDVLLVTTDESVKMKQYVLIEDNQWFEVFMFSRSLFRQLCEGMTTTVGPASMRHSGKLAYCSDSSLEKYFKQDNRLGAYEKACRLYCSGAWWYFFFQKLNKYCGQGKIKRAYLLLGHVVHGFATLLIVSKGLIPEREVIEQAAEIEPELFAPFKEIIFSSMPDSDEILNTAEQMRKYVFAHLHSVFSLLIDFLKEEGRMTPLSVIHDRFSKVLNNGNCELSYGACEILCEAKILEKSVEEIRVTKRSTHSFLEPAYMFIAQ